MPASLRLSAFRRPVKRGPAGPASVAEIRQDLAAKTSFVLSCQGMRKSVVNTAELGRVVHRRRKEQGLSLRDLAQQTGVSASTLSRIENGSGKPDAENIARLTSWLQIPIERIMGGSEGGGAANAVIYYPHESTPEIVEAHLRADRHLTRETARALAELFRVAYAQFSQTANDKPPRKRS